MTRIRKYLLGTGIIALLLITIIYYKSSQVNIDVEDENENQISIISIQSNEKNDTIQDVDDTVEQTTADTDNNNENIASGLYKNKIYQDDKSKINELITRYYDITNKFDTKILLSNKQEEIDQRKELFSRKKEIIQNYESIQNYIKQGLTENTYIVYTTYDIKLKNIDTLVPGMSVLTVVKDETSGELFVNVSPNNKDLNDYIKQVAESDDMKEIIEEVNRELTKAIKNDASLKEFVEYLKEIA